MLKKTYFRDISLVFQRDWNIITVVENHGSFCKLPIVCEYRPTFLIEVNSRRAAVVRLKLGACWLEMTPLIKLFKTLLHASFRDILHMEQPKRRKWKHAALTGPLYSRHVAPSWSETHSHVCVFQCVWGVVIRGFDWKSRQIAWT